MNVTQLGPFVLLGRTGSGRFGSVFRSRDVDGTPISIMIAHDSLSAHRGFRDRLAVQVATASGSRGAMIAPWVAAAPHDPQPWLAVAPPPGPGLDAAGALPPGNARHLAGRLAAALSGLHRAGLIHHHLTPAAVVLSSGDPYLLDFGIPRAAVESGAAPDAALGAPGFCSPEQARGEPAGPASDVFALASVIVFAATGRSPFHRLTTAANPLATLRTVIDEPPDLTAVPADLKDALLPCFDKDPASRPTAEELLDALPPGPAAWPPPQVATSRQPDLPVEPAPVAPPARVAPGPAPAAPPGRGPSRKVLAVAALGAAVVLLAAGAVAAVAALRPVSSGHADPPPPAPAAAAAPMTGPRLAAEILAQTRVAGSGKYQMRIEIPGDEPSMVHNGEFRYLRDQVSVSVEEVYEGIPTATIVLDGQSWHMPPVGGTPGMTAAQPWLDCPSSDPDFERYCQIPALRQDDADPGGMLSLLGDTVTIEKSAPDNLAGTSAIRYDLRIDWDAAEIRETDPARRARITFNGRGSRPEPSVLWVDEQHRPLRWERDEVMILDYYGWGEPVVITPPPAELTVSR